ncbi:MAG: hypothetical protein KJN92_01750 [Gemmatimonadetes bacterium]|nr:hypothetical protein [Gemmatimonadota bacterium]
MNFEMSADGFKIEVINTSKALMEDVRKLADGLELLEAQLSTLAMQLEQRQALSPSEVMSFRNQIQLIPTIDRNRLQTMEIRLDSIGGLIPGAGLVRPPGGA